MDNEARHAAIVKEEKMYSEQLRIEKDEKLKIYQSDYIAIRKMYEAKRLEIERCMQEIYDEYHRKLAIASKMFDKKFRMLKSEEITPKKRETVRFTVKDFFKPPKIIWHNDCAIATYYGTRYESHAQVVRGITLAKKRVLNLMIRHVVDCIVERKREIEHHLSYEKEVMITFFQAQRHSSIKKVVYVDAERNYMPIYFDHIFENGLSRKIMIEMIQRELNARVSVINDACILSPL